MIIRIGKPRDAQRFYAEPSLFNWHAAPARSHAHRHESGSVATMSTLTKPRAKKPARVVRKAAPSCFVKLAVPADLLPFRAGAMKFSKAEAAHMDRGRCRMSTPAALRQTA